MQQIQIKHIRLKYVQIKLKHLRVIDIRSTRYIKAMEMRVDMHIGQHL